MSVLVEKNGLTTVILNRPEVRNAVNPQTARELLDVLRCWASVWRVCLPSISFNHRSIVSMTVRLACFDRVADLDRLALPRVSEIGRAEGSRVPSRPVK
jgi:hypothetical protein